jgi:hypothetical protein
VLFAVLKKQYCWSGVKKVGKVDRAKAMFGPTLSVETNYAGRTAPQHNHSGMMYRVVCRRADPDKTGMKYEI